MTHYRAIRASYGFRGRHWETGDVAEDVTPEEAIPPHFERIDTADIPAKPRNESFEEREPETLSDWQEHENRPEPAPGLEDRKTKPHPKPKRK